jgi:uncharacterized C2H2 Zn-finger protein
LHEPLVPGDLTRARLPSASSVTFSSDSGEGMEESSGGVGAGQGSVGPPPYRCPYCPKEFMESKAYLRHRDRTHASVSRPCPDCDATFKRTDHLSRHMRTVHSHSCPVCHESLSGQLAFESHMATQHPLAVHTLPPHLSPTPPPSHS